ncbi:hypothetical protein LINPERPRIM_LOCUS17455 [Linum perenne]
MLNISTIYHPQTDGQFKWTIITIEELLGSCVLEFQEQWVKTCAQNGAFLQHILP